MKMINDKAVRHPTDSNDIASQRSMDAEGFRIPKTTVNL
jgi:hypothetical protein